VSNPHERQPTPTPPEYPTPSPRAGGDHPHPPARGYQPHQTTRKELMSDIDNVMRRYSEAQREERTQRKNSEREAQGLTPLHCGVEVKIDRLGDYECQRCGATF
jgi:predicted SprT family Zn-dependent metalloprotease